jgi:hypothetical protein
VQRLSKSGGAGRPISATNGPGQCVLRSLETVKITSTRAVHHAVAIVKPAADDSSTDRLRRLDREQRPNMPQSSSVKIAGTHHVGHMPVHLSIDNVASKVTPSSLIESTTLTSTPVTFTEIHSP